MVSSGQLKVDYRIERLIAPGASNDEAITISGTILGSEKDNGNCSAFSPAGVIQAVVFHGSTPKGMENQFESDPEWLAVYEDYLENLKENEYVFGLEDEDGSVEVSTNPNCFLLTFVGLVPSFRGKGIGARAIRNMLDTFAVRKCGAAFVLPFPLHFDHETFLRNDFSRVQDLFKANTDVSFTPLLNFYKAMGFRQLKDSRLFFLNMDVKGWDGSF